MDRNEFIKKHCSYWDIELTLSHLDNLIENEINNRINSQKPAISELELSEMFWKNPEYNQRMSFAAFKKLASKLTQKVILPTDEEIQARIKQGLYHTGDTYEGFAESVFKIAVNWIKSMNQ